MINETISAIEAAEKDGRAVQVPGVEGLSGDSLIGALQRLARIGDAGNCYLEVGVFRGLTLVSVASAAPDRKVFGIDNFSQFDPEGKNRGIVERAIESQQLKNVGLINADFEVALEGLERYLDGRKIGTYFVDGPHDYRSQLMCLMLARPFLAEHAVILVDDSNYLHVRQANRDFLVLEPSYKLLFEAYTRTHPNNLTDAERVAARKGWWNGVNILVHDPSDSLETSYPAVAATKDLFLNDHTIHASKLAPCADVAITTVQDIIDLKLWRAVKGVARAATWSKKRPTSLRTDYVSANTHSASLAQRRMSVAKSERRR